jgi:hypothetical protein
MERRPSVAHDHLLPASVRHWSEHVPERQTGFELLGNYRASVTHSIDYHVTLGAATEFKGLDGNKAIGARLCWETDAIGDLRIGGSVYDGREAASTEVPEIGPNGRLLFREAVTKLYGSLSLAADLLWRSTGCICRASSSLSSASTPTPAGRAQSVHRRELSLHPAM